MAYPLWKQINISFWRCSHLEICHNLSLLPSDLERSQTNELFLTKTFWREKSNVFMFCLSLSFSTTKSCSHIKNGSFAFKKWHSQLLAFVWNVSGLKAIFRCSSFFSTTIGLKYTKLKFNTKFMTRTSWIKACWYQRLIPVWSWHNFEIKLSTFFLFRNICLLPGNWISTE